MKFKLWYYKSTDNKFYKESEIVRACSSILVPLYDKKWDVKNEKDNFFRRSFVIFYIFSFK